MRELVAVIVKVLDPVALLVSFVLIGTMFKFGKKAIPITALLVAVAGETFLTKISYTRTWGESLIPGIIAGAIQALVAYWIVARLRRPKAKTSQDTPA